MLTTAFIIFILSRMMFEIPYVGSKEHNLWKIEHLN